MRLNFIPMIQILTLSIASITVWGAPPGNPVDYRKPPESEHQYGVVRVWNASNEPPLDPNYIPEAKLGQRIIVEIKNFDQWLCENLEKGAWPADAVVSASDSDKVSVAHLIKTRGLTSAVRAARWLGNHPPSEGEDSVAVLGKLQSLIETNKEGLGGIVLPGEDEQGSQLNPKDANDANKIVEVCQNALRFSEAFKKRKVSELILTINNQRLVGIVPHDVTTDVDPIPRKQNGYDAYSWLSFRLDRPKNGDFERAWSQLVPSPKSPFSIKCSVSLSATDQAIPLSTSVIEDAQDTRCRFELITTTPALRKERKENKFQMDDEVYPVDERVTKDGDRHIKKGEIVEVDDTQSDPYVVHFQDLGGTKRYNGADLARLPPDPIPLGVIRVWNSTQPNPNAETAQAVKVPQAKVRDLLVVEVRNFDGWLCNAIDHGLLKDDPLVRNASDKLKKIIEKKQFWSALRVGAWLRGNSKQQANLTALEILPELREEIKKNPKLDVDFPDLQTLKLRSGTVEKQLPATGTGVNAKKENVIATGDLKKTSDLTEKQDEVVALEFLAACREALALLQELEKNKLRNLILTINDIPLNITPDNADYSPIKEAIRPFGDPAEDTYHWLSFSMVPKPSKGKRDTEKLGEDPWKRLLEDPSFTMPSKVTLTLNSGSETLILPTAVTKEAKDERCRFNLVGIVWWIFWPTAAVVVLILLSLAIFAGTTNILRDSSQRRPDGLEPVSLAKTQMAFWFTLIALAFAFLWVTTGTIDSINGTCLTLLGIGTTTALSAAAIDKTRHDNRKDLSDVLHKTSDEMLKTDPEKLRDAIQAKKAELDNLPEGTMTPQEMADARNLLEREEAKIANFLQDKPKWLSSGRPFAFGYRLWLVLTDLLCEDPGCASYDFHRFQILAWTLVLGVVFIVKVFADRAMPQFDSNLLLLMGISSGAFIGFKLATPRPKQEDDGKTTRGQ